MGMVSTQRGRMAEDAAAWYLRGRGWHILDRNRRTPVGELDLVCREGEAVVMVEVKARSGNLYGEALESVGPRKERRLRAAAGWWAAEHGGEFRLRFDVVVVALLPDGSLHSLAHIRDVFGNRG
ncbi:MAG: YraN family protein [Thermoleophilia bacterium]|nr:YraN family protein [Thermoleophilia bacterium]